MKTITIRGVSPDLAAALEEEKSRRGLSLNRTVIGLMNEALGISEEAERGNGLRRLAGTSSVRSCSKAPERRPSGQGQPPTRGRTRNKPYAASSAAAPRAAAAPNRP